MWYRSWIETRWRMVLMLLVNTFICALLVDDTATIEAWRARFSTVLPMIFAMNAIVLAGSGVASQVSQKPGQAVHTSMLFLLSLPITRRRLVLVRQAVGAIAALCVVLVTITAYATAAPEIVRGTAPAVALAYLAGLIPVILVAYAVSALLSTVLDQLWQTYAAMAIVGAVLGGISQTRVWNVAFELSAAANGQGAGHVWEVLGLAALCCGVVSTALAFAAVRVVERKQF